MSCQTIFVVTCDLCTCEEKRDSEVQPGDLVHTGKNPELKWYRVQRGSQWFDLCPVCVREIQRVENITRRFSNSGEAT